MSESGWRERIAKEEYRPTIAAFGTAVAFCFWNVVFDPRFFVTKLSAWLSFTGDKVIDAELFRATGNLLLIAMLMATIKFVFRQSLVDYGLGLGHWMRQPLLVFASPLMLLFGYIGSRQAEYQAYYPDTPGLVGRSFSVFLLHAGVLVTFYIAWELLFRGFLQTTLVARLGAVGAVAVQTLASSLAHADRPDSELIASIVVGAIWGHLAYRTGSIWPAILQHLLLGLTLDYFLWLG